MLIFKKGRQKGIVLKGKRAFFAKGVQAYFALDISIGGGGLVWNFPHHGRGKENG